MAESDDGLAENLLSRRAVLKAATATAGVLLVSGNLPCANTARADSINRQPADVTAWVRISPDNTVTLIASQSEMGQGVTTTLAAVLADELDFPIDKVRIEFAPFGAAYRDPVYNWMFTGNSQGISSFYDVMRIMGAAAREMLMAAAAARLGKPVETLTSERGTIQHRDSGKSVTYGDVAADAAKLPVPAHPQLRQSSLRSGRSVPRWDIPAKVDGSAVFGIDVKVPGMLLATVLCAPRFGSKLMSYDAAAIKAMPGVVRVVEIPSGLAVVATTYWQAKKALDVANPKWSGVGSALTSGTDIAAEYKQALASGPFHAHKSEGKVTSDPDIESVYQVPFQAHATMEPMNCTAHITRERCDIWVPTQGVELAQQVAAMVTGLPSDRIVIHRTMIGGGFGRRLLADFLKQTLLIAKTVDRPVKMIWSREEDMTHDFYRPAMRHRIGGSLDNKDQVASLAHRVVSPSHMLYIFPRGMFPTMKDWTEPATPPIEMDVMALEGVLEIPYAVPNQLVEQCRLELSVPVSVWRTTGHGPNNFVLESFLDELANRKHLDPFEFRERHLAHNARALNVLRMAAQKSGWKQQLASGRAQGIALAHAFGSLIAMVVELSVVAKEIKLHRIVCAVDCGRILDPSSAESNILGGIVWGLSGMMTAVTFLDGTVQQRNFMDFMPAQLRHIPQCEVYFINSGAKLGGLGELSAVPVHAAVCNAVFAATGVRIRTLPLAASGFSLG